MGGGVVANRFLHLKQDGGGGARVYPCHFEIEELVKRSIYQINQLSEKKKVN